MIVKFCKDCKFSHPEPNSTWCLRCSNPVVNSGDPYALASGIETFYASCQIERTKTWFSACGIKGKLFQQKD